MATAIRPAWLRARRWGSITIITIFTLLVLLVAIWLALPSLIKHVALQQIETQIGRQASIGKVDFQPLALTLTISDFILYEPDQRAIAFSAPTLRLKLAPAALFQLAPLLDEVTLQAPALHIVLTAGGNNFSDVIARIAAMPKSAKPTLFSIANIRLENGSIQFDDVAGKKRLDIAALNLGLPFVSNFPNQIDTFVQPRLSATVNGTRFALKGRSKPFAGSQDTVLALDVERLDLASYRDFMPLALPVALRSAQLSTRLDLTFVRKRGKPEVLLSGDVKLSDIALLDAVAAPLLTAQALNAHIDKLDVLSGAATLDQVELLGARVWLAADAPLSAARIALEHASVDVAARTVQADALRLEQPRGAVRRDAQGKFVLRPPLVGTGGAPAGAPWVATLKQFSVTDGALAYLDNAVTPAVALRADGLNLTLDDVSSKFERPVKLTLRTRLNTGGKLALDGSVAPQAINLAIDAEDLSVAAVQPYFSDYLNVTLATGQLGAKGNIMLLPSKGQWSGSYGGALRLANFRALDKDNAADFLKWQSLDISAIDTSLGGPQPHVTLGKIALSDFYARIILSESATLNVQNILASNKTPAGAPAPSLTSSEGAAKAAVAAAPTANLPVIAIGQVVIKGGNVNYTDNFVQPHYTANLTGVNGSVGAFASDQARPAPIDLSGKIDNDAALAVSGALNPLSRPLFLDIKASAHGIELPRLTPYAAKYAGYAIEKGKLSMEVNYRVEHDKLVAQNQVRIEQLTFGDKIDSPSATKLPVLLALALLKDRAGQINLDLPISGTLSDPQFSVGGIIGRVFVNLMSKAVTSPFALIGSIFGGGEELGYAEFEPGSATLSEPAQAKLDTLALALTERPALQLDLSGRADPDSDADGVRQQILRRKLRAFKRKDSLNHGGESSSDELSLSVADKDKYMEKVYAAEKFDKPRNALGLLKTLAPAEMEKLILANTTVTPDALTALANKRAMAVRAYLDGKGGVAAERIFLVAPKLSDAARDKVRPSRVEFALK
ncbi:hypothetical protein AAKU55_004154 [Oxalobacteraceae bacterium GrIS 1.11]